MAPVNRRQFLADVGRGVLAASVGSGLAVELGFHGEAFADEPGGALCFGRLEPLVAMLQETPIDKLIPTLAGKLREQLPVGVVALLPDRPAFQRRLQ